MVIVEQSDTIVHDYLDIGDVGGAKVREFRSSGYGDERDKFIRLTLRNASIAEPTSPQKRQARAAQDHGWPSTSGLSSRRPSPTSTCCRRPTPPRSCWTKALHS